MILILLYKLFKFWSLSLYYTPMPFDIPKLFYLSIFLFLTLQDHPNNLAYYLVKNYHSLLQKKNL